MAILLVVFVFFLAPHSFLPTSQKIIIISTGLSKICGGCAVLMDKDNKNSSFYLHVLIYLKRF